MAKAMCAIVCIETQFTVTLPRDISVRNITNSAHAICMAEDELTFRRGRRCLRQIVVCNKGAKTLQTRHVV
jgi:hypothetical protein